MGRLSSDAALDRPVAAPCGRRPSTGADQHGEECDGHDSERHQALAVGIASAAQHGERGNKTAPEAPRTPARRQARSPAVGAAMAAPPLTTSVAAAQRQAAPPPTREHEQDPRCRSSSGTGAHRAASRGKEHDDREHERDECQLLAPIGATESAIVIHRRNRANSRPAGPCTSRSPRSCS